MADPQPYTPGSFISVKATKWDRRENGWAFWAFGEDYKESVVWGEVLKRTMITYVTSEDPAFKLSVRFPDEESANGYRIDDNVRSSEVVSTKPYDEIPADFANPPWFAKQGLPPPLPSTLRAVHHIHPDVDVIDTRLSPNEQQSKELKINSKKRASKAAAKDDFVSGPDLDTAIDSLLKQKKADATLPLV